MNTSHNKLFTQTALLLTLVVSFLTDNLSAAPKFLTDTVFNQATIIGKVFLDSNMNGYLDNDEIGLQGVRIATVTGLLIKTDSYGHFHILDNNINDARFGENELLKVDRFSLPQGSRFTTENPRLLRISNKALNKMNFGVVF